ncbi:MAG: hypothetical protein H6735_17930 [Alphaproteobacteria bacterium]|nr:hypothetical protein [Alphaproteobacteria bacterium]
MEVPAAYKNAGLANLIGGAWNAFVAFGVVMSLIWFCVGILWLVPMGASGYSAYVGWQMYNGEATPAAKNASIAGIIGGLLCFNPLSAIASGFAMMQLGNDEVKGWLEQHGAA